MAMTENREQRAEVVEAGKGRLLVVAGPSGSGKSTLTRAAIERTSAVLSVSATTRPKSEQEVDGQHYTFLDEDEFEKKVEAGEFLEYAKVFDHYYGTPAEPVRKELAQGRAVILEIDVQGALQVFEKAPEAEGVLILPPSEAVLEERIRKRGRDDAATIEKRLAKARWEIETARSHPNFCHTVVNNDLEQAIQDMVKIIEERQG